MPGRSRTPPQGGLPLPLDLDERVVRIACDESGFSGRNMLDPSTPLFAHASVDLDVVEAAALVAELRSRTRWSRSELKSGPLLRGPQAGEVRTVLLASLCTDGVGRANVLLVDKEFFLATRVVDLFLEDPSYAAGTAATRTARPAARDLYRAGRAHPDEWATFLRALVTLVRTKQRSTPPGVLVERLLGARDDLVAAVGSRVPAALAGLDRAHVRDVVDRLDRGDPLIPPPLEPLVPALAGTVLHWSRGHRQVLVTHDEQSALTAPRLRRLQRTLALDGTDAAETPEPHRSSSPTRDARRSSSPARSALAGLVSVDSRDDPRVQVADLLAGVVRRTQGVATDRHLAPLLSDASLWDPCP